MPNKDPIKRRETSLKYQRSVKGKANQERYRKKHLDYYKVKSREQSQKIREKVLDFFGKKCNNINCPIPIDKLDIRTLQLDHVNNNGYEERKQIGRIAIYKRALDNPKEYQLLCPYCNWLKRYLRE